MQKSDSLIQLIHSLSKQEKKEFSIYISNKPEKDYILLFRLVNEKKIVCSEELKRIFLKKRPGGSFNTAVTYLYNLLIELLTNLRLEQDSYYQLFNELLHARVLYEKSMYEECLQTLKQVKGKAVQFENHFALLIAQRLELNYLLTQDFIGLNETQLLNKQHKLRNTVKEINKLNEQSSLYELLKLRTLDLVYLRSKADTHKLDDLVTSEISIVASPRNENFEIKKNHQLFQAYYYIAVGDYKAAFSSFIELNRLFEENTHLWNNPPVYYLMVVKGMLETLRIIHDYTGMAYFLEKLQRLESESSWFQLDVTCTIYIYRLSIYIDLGNFTEAVELINEYRPTLLEKLEQLKETQQAEASLYTAYVYLVTGEHRKARRLLGKVIGKKHLYLPALYRIIRIINMMIAYELGNIDFIHSETRSIKRDMRNSKEGSMRVEQLLLKFLNSSWVIGDTKARMEAWKSIEEEAQALYTDKYEKQILHKIDFVAWIESKVLEEPLSDVLKRRHKKYTTKLRSAATTI